MRCLRCDGLLLIEYLDHEQVRKCLCCGARIYPPIPTIPERLVCYHCKDAPVPGQVCCAVCRDRLRDYRAAHPNKRKKYGPVLPVVTEV